MSQLSVRKTYEDGTDPTEQQLDDIRESIEEFFNVTKVNDDNIQDDGITGSDKLVDESVSAEKVASSAAETAKFQNGAVTAAKLAAGSVTTGKIAATNVTRAKMAAVNYAVSSDINTVFTSASETTVGTAVLTTGGRPVRISMMPRSGGGSNGPSLQVYTASTSASNDSRMTFTLYRDGTQIDKTIISMRAPEIGHMFSVPGTTLNFYDMNPSAAEHTYVLKVAVNSAAFGISITINGRLMVYEL